MKSLAILMIFLIFSLFNEAITHNSKCDIKLGCIMRVKYYSHVTFQSQTGQPLPIKSSLNYKIIYVYNDRMVFYSSQKSTEIALELERERTKLVDESNIERTINFSNIILDCGKYLNKLCFAQNYPDIETIPFFNKIKKAIPTNPDIKCIVIPFFENSYKQSHDKVAFICIHEIRQIKELIQFKNSLSRAIEQNQRNLADDRFNGFNGIRRNQNKFIFFKNNKPVAVIGRLYGKKISLLTNDKFTAHIKDFSLLEIRNSGVYFVNEAIKKGKLMSNWNKDYELPATDECCIVFPGELIICAANKNGKSIENASDICKVRLETFMRSAKIQIKSIKLSENAFILVSDRKKFEDCSSKEYIHLKKRVDNTITKDAVEDCLIEMNYSQSSFDNKLSYCFKHIADELKLEINLLANANSLLYNKLSECIYNDNHFKMKLTKKYLKKLLGLNNKKTSFIDIEESNKDFRKKLKIKRRTKIENTNK